MRTRFSPVLEESVSPPPELSGVNLLLGGVSITGTPLAAPYEAGYWFTSLAGWWDAADSTGQTTQFLSADGGWSNRAYRAFRQIDITGHVEAGSRPELRDAVEQLMAAIPVDPLVPLVVYEDGLARHCMVRMSGQPKVSWAGGHLPVADFNISLVAPDPRKLAGPGGDLGWRVLGPVGLPSTTGGLTFQFTLPTAFTAVTTSGQVTLDFEGTAVPNAVVEFTGPVLNPGVREVGTGRTLWFDLEVMAGQTLSVDLRTRSVLLNGVSRRGKRRGQWIAPSPGAVWEFTAAEYNADARMTVLTQEAWI